MTKLNLPKIIIDGIDYTEQLRGKKIEAGKSIITLPKNHKKNENINITIKKPSTSTYTNFLNFVIYGVRYNGKERLLDKITSSSGRFDIIEGNLYWRGQLVDNSGLWLSLAATRGLDTVWGIRGGQLYKLDQTTGEYQKHTFDTSSYYTSDKYNIDHLTHITGVTGGDIYLTSGVYRTWYSAFRLDTINNTLNVLNSFYRQTLFSNTWEKHYCIHGLDSMYSSYGTTCYLSPALGSDIESINHFCKSSTQYNSSLEYLKMPTGFYGYEVPLYIANGFLCYYTGKSASVMNHTSKPASAISNLKGWTHLCNGYEASYAIRNGILYKLYEKGDSTPTLTVLDDTKEWIELDAYDKGYALTSDGELYMLEGDEPIYKYFEVELTENKDYQFSTGDDKLNKFPQIQLTKEFLDSLII